MIHLKSTLIHSLQSNGISGLQESLQTAIELEHATIPPYLYALYSLGTDPANTTVADIIQSVVSEEMLHMTLACNLLNAVGGTPLIDTPEFIPTYPGPLPGSVESGLTVHLAPFSTEVIKDTFMAIEEPESPADFPSIKHVDLAATASVTIGQFYNAIIDQMKALEKAGVDVFTGDPALQVKPPFEEGAIVTDLDSAIAAIELIIDQGEGTNPSESPLDGGPDGELAHYYRFAEIAEGNALVPIETAPGWSYSGDPIVAEGPIANIATNPSSSAFPTGSAERHAMDNFNYTYTSLLKGLHMLFNGKTDTFSRTLGAMMSLRQQALTMMSGTNLHGPIGPSFEYQPVNPDGLT